MSITRYSEYNKGYNIKGIVSMSKYQKGTAGISMCVNTSTVVLPVQQYNNITAGQVKAGPLLVGHSKEGAHGAHVQ